MAILKKKKGNYYAVFYDPACSPPRKWVPMRTKDKVAANTKMVGLEREYALKIYDPWIDKKGEKLTFNRAISLFLKSRSHCVEASICNYEAVLSLLSRSVGGSLPVNSIKQQDLKSFLTNPDWANATQQNYFRHIRAFCNWAYSEGHITEDVLDGLKLPKVQNNNPKYITKAQLDSVVSVIREEYRENETQKQRRALWLDDVIIFAFCTGLRLSEVCRLQWDDVDLESGHFIVANRGKTATKSGSERTVALTAPSSDVIERRKNRSTESSVYVFTSGDDESQLNAKYVSKRFRHFRKKAGLPDGINFHSLRHSFGSAMASQGVSMYTISKIMGHSSLEVTQKYAHLAPETMRNEMERVFGAGYDASLG